MWQFGRASDEEGIRLMRAYFLINEPENRIKVIELAEAYAAASIQIAPPPFAIRQDNEPEM